MSPAGPPGPNAPATVPALLAAATASDPGRPRLTWYGADGERVELSARVLANWVAKTANLLQEEFDVGPGSTVAVALPVHWQTAAVLLGTWTCGAAVLDTAAEDDDRLADADVVLCSQDRIEAIEEAGATEVLGLSLHPLGLGMRDYVGEARDFAVEVRAEEVRLTYVEFEILAALARAPGRVLTREALLEQVWGDSDYRDPRTIDVHIRHLREKLEAEPKTPELILTVRGVGYRFRDT